MATVVLQNLSPHPYEGWLTATAAGLTDAEVLISGRGKCRGLPFAVGKQLGLRGNLVDVKVKLAAGESVQAALEFEDGPSGGAAPPIAKMGHPTVMGIEMVFQGLEKPGGVWHAHLRARVTPMLVVDLWLDLTTDGWARFLCRVTASNTGIPDVTATIPPDFTLACGGAAVAVLNGGFGTLLPAGLSMGDGQSLFIPGTMVWPELLPDDAARKSAAAMATGQVGAWDQAWQQNIGPLKAVADLPTAFSGEAWARQNYRGALARLQSWQEGPLGITANSGQTGAEEEQPGLGKGAPVFAGGGWEAVQTLRFVGLGFGRVPCHYREPDGSPLRLDHRDLMIWDGRPHKAMPDLLGKLPDSFGDWLSHGWWGPNDEHAFIGTLCSDYQLTGDPGLQSLIDDRARLYLYSDTIDPRMSTSGPRAARARGWASIEVAWFWLTLEDRALAQRVRDRYVQRLAMYRAAAEHDGWMWDPRGNDVQQGDLIGLGKAVWSDASPSPFPAFVMGYQAAVAVGGIQIAGEVLDLPDSRDLAYREAMELMDRCFQQQPDGSWVGYEVLGIRPDGSTLSPSEFVEGRGAHHSGLFDGGAWWSLAIFTILRHDPENAKARAIYEGWRAKAMHGREMLDWLPPFRTR